MKEIYNEGRVVGLSAYEIYVRHFLHEFPDEPILTEREWLAATLGNGSSMLLKLKKGLSAGVVDYPLPANSDLCSVQTVTASLFNGTAAFDVDDTWATKIISYGPNISNTASKNPTTPGENMNQVPHQDIKTWEDNNIHMLREYAKIVDGIAYHPGQWIINHTDPPQKDLIPDLHKPSVIRLRITETLEEDVLVLLTGFIYRPLISGISKDDEGSLNTQHPENGDFLGSEVFPWSTKIVFTVPSEVFAALNKRAYVRKLPATGKEMIVDSHAVVDFETTDPKTYYEENTEYKDSQILINVTDLNVMGSNASVLGTYQRTDNTSGGLTGTDYPPVLYGARVDKTGQQSMSPIDIAAPGTVKMFEDKDLAMNYPKIFPNIYALYNSEEGDIFIIDDETTEEDLVPITTKVKVINKGTESAPQYITSTRARDDRTDKVVERSVYAVSMRDTNDKELSTTGSKSSAYSDDNGTVKDNTWLNGTNGLAWDILLNALGLDKKIELLGVPLRTFRSNLPNIVSGEGGILNILGNGKSKIAGDLEIAKTLTVNGDGDNSGYNALTNENEFKFNKAVKSGKNYITFSNGLRLYISKDVPSDTDVPIGSIGIGWGLATDK